MHMPHLKDYSYHLIKYESNWASKIPISQVFHELEKTWKCSLRATFQNLNCESRDELRKFMF